LCRVSVIAAVLLVTTGCPNPAFLRGGHPVFIDDRPGPPAHAKAHGRRGKFNYHYYPTAEVYFDPGRSLYFYYSSGTWLARATLPTTIVISHGSYVSLDLDTGKPYLNHKAHKAKYPPGQLKKKGKSKGKGKGKGKSRKK